jgi:hypothetical protein
MNGLNKDRTIHYANSARELKLSSLHSHIYSLKINHYYFNNNNNARGGIAVLYMCVGF